MNTNTNKLHELGQRLWDDNIRREMLVHGERAPLARFARIHKKSSQLAQAGI